MTEFFRWSIDLGRWAGIRVRLHFVLPLSIVLILIGAAMAEKPRVVPSLAWLALLGLVLAIHELGHIAVARWRGSDVEDIYLWPLGNFVLPTKARAMEDPFVVAGGLVASGGCALGSMIALSTFGARMVLDPFGGPIDSGAPSPIGAPPGEIFRALTPIWYLGWFGWLSWMLFVANLLPALPFDMGRIVRCARGRPALGIGRDALIAPYTAHVVAGLLFLIALFRLGLYGGSRFFDAVTLVMLALLVEAMVRVEAVMMEDGGFFDEGAFGYDFSEGYTSLETGGATVRPRRESALKRWRRRRSDVRLRRRREQVAAESRRLDEILDKLHRTGRASLSDEENRFLVRVSSEFKKRPRERA